MFIRRLQSVFTKISQRVFTHMHTQSLTTRPLKIAVVGTGISGMAAAWLLAQSHDVTVYEKNDHVGGHSNTVSAKLGGALIPVDTGFIVYNDANYPNLTALFSLLSVPTMDSEMSFSASLADGDFEYSGTSLNGLIGQRKNIFRPRFWKMLNDIRRFYKEAPKFLEINENSDITLGNFLTKNNYCESFINDHLMPMGAAIWSTTVDDMKNYPAVAFMRFFQSHGLLTITNRPTWKTVVGGSREYVKRLTQSYNGNIRFERVTSILRHSNSVEIQTTKSEPQTYDHVVIASHADEALQLLDNPTPKENELLSKWKYTKNMAILHTDPKQMPKRHRVWSSWNFIQTQANGKNNKICLTYWMNRLQNIDYSKPLFVTLNPNKDLSCEKIISQHEYMHPYFDNKSLKTQKNLWELQGINRTWFCGSYFGYGFHEDGLQSGLAVAESLGGTVRPWDVIGANNRITTETSI